MKGLTSHSVMSWVSLSTQFSCYFRGLGISLGYDVIKILRFTKTVCQFDRKIDTTVRVVVISAVLKTSRDITMLPVIVTMLGILLSYLAIDHSIHN